MHDMVTRNRVQILRAAGHSVDDVARRTGVSPRSVKRIAKEAPVTSFDDAAERRRRKVRRPSVVDKWRSAIREIVQEKDSSGNPLQSKEVVRPRRSRAHLRAETGLPPRSPGRGSWSWRRRRQRRPDHSAPRRQADGARRVRHAPVFPRAAVTSPDAQNPTEHRRTLTSSGGSDAADADTPPCRPGRTRVRHPTSLRVLKSGRNIRQPFSASSARGARRTARAARRRRRRRGAGAAGPGARRAPRPCGRGTGACESACCPTKARRRPAGSR